MYIVRNLIKIIIIFAKYATVAILRQGMESVSSKIHYVGLLRNKMDFVILAGLAMKYLAKLVCQKLLKWKGLMVLMTLIVCNTKIINAENAHQDII